MLARRSFLAGLGSMLAAPAIVHAGNLMPVKALRPEVVDRIWASNQSGYTITIDPAVSAFKVGDIISIEGVNDFNRILKMPLTSRRQFVITADAKPGERIICLYPPIAGIHYEPYRTVDEYPKNGARIFRVQSQFA